MQYMYVICPYIVQSERSIYSFLNIIFLNQVRLIRTEVARTPSSTRQGFKSMITRSWQYISCHWETCSNHLDISDFGQETLCSQWISVIMNIICNKVNHSITRQELCNGWLYSAHPNSISVPTAQYTKHISIAYYQNISVYLQHITRCLFSLVVCVIKEVWRLHYTYCMYMDNDEAVVTPLYFPQGKNYLWLKRFITGIAHLMKTAQGRKASER